MPGPAAIRASAKTDPASVAAAFTVIVGAGLRAAWPMKATTFCRVRRVFRPPGQRPGRKARRISASAAGRAGRVRDPCGVRRRAVTSQPWPTGNRVSLSRIFLRTASARSTPRTSASLMRYWSTSAQLGFDLGCGARVVHDFGGLFRCEPLEACQ